MNVISIRSYVLLDFCYFVIIIWPNFIFCVLFSTINVFINMY